MGTDRASEPLVRQFDLYERQTAEAGRYKGYKVSFLSVKPRLPTIFPGFDTYIWIDADCWVQGACVIGKLADAAQKATFITFDTRCRPRGPSTFTRICTGTTLAK
jgi:hypothetical protein